MENLNGVIQWFEKQKEMKEVARVVSLITDVKIVQRVRELREHEKNEDKWVAAAAIVLDDLERQHRELDHAYAEALQQLTTNRQEILDEVRRLRIIPQRIEEYQGNSILLQCIQSITDYASAASFLKGAPGVEEISRMAYETAMGEGKQITAERKKERNNELFDVDIARRMVPVLLRCEFTEDGEFVQHYFLALHKSFARKVLQDVKERLRGLFPSFGDLVAEMQTKITAKNVHNFLFTRECGCLIAVLKAHVWSKDQKRKYGVLLERRPREEEIKVLNVASTGDGPDELAAYIGKTFRYKVHEVDGRLYPELRHLRDNYYPLYRFLLKVLRDFGWEVPTQWPSIRYPHW